MIFLYDSYQIVQDHIGSDAESCPILVFDYLPWFSMIFIYSRSTEVKLKVKICTVCLQLKSLKENDLLAVQIRVDIYDDTFSKKELMQEVFRNIFKRASTMAKRR